MIGPDVRNAIYQLHQAGMSQREISRRLHVSRNAVRKIVKQQGRFARRERSDKKQIDNQLLERAPPPANPDTGVHRRERIGGLLNYYHREAA